MDFILRKAGRHPFVLQLLSYHLLSIKRAKGSLTENDLKVATNKSRGQLISFFENILHSLQLPQRQALMASVDLGSVDTIDRTVLNKLEKQGYVMFKHKDIDPFCGLFEDFIKARSEEASGKRGIGHRSILAQPSTETIKPGQVRRSPFVHGYALLIGVGADLPVTVQDATSLYRVLVNSDRCAYIPDHVKLLTKGQATRQNILDGLDWLATQAQNDPAATVIVYFSGHGGYMPDYHLIPYGYDVQASANTTVSGLEFTHRLRAIRAKKLLVLLDCCHAGGMADIKASGFAKSPVPPELDAALTVGSGRVVIASSRKDQVSYTGTPCSVFTQALLEGLSGYGAAERDGYAYIADVALYVGRMVPNRTSDKQHPILKLAAADNFAIAYYAGGEKSPKPLVGAQTHLPPIEVIDADLVESYRRILKKYQGHLLAIEERMAQFIDQAVIPLDLERVKEGILRKIAEVETTIEKQASQTGWTPRSVATTAPTLEDVLRRLDEMNYDLGERLDDLAIIYRRISTNDQAVLEAIQVEIQQGRLEQTEIQHALDAIRQVLGYIQRTGLPIADEKVKQSLADIYQAVNSDLNFQQQLELSLPVIPFLLEYKIGLGGGVDLGAVWKELVERVRRR